MKTSSKIVDAKIKFPKLSTKTVWAGVYGGHYDQIVFFSKKPVKSKDYNVNLYDCYDNKEIIIGDMGLGEFKELYPGADLSAFLDQSGKPKDIEVVEVFQIRLEAMYDEYGNPSSLTFRDQW